MNVVWVRHGESEANAGGATSHPGEIPLTERGHQQAVELAAAWTRAPDSVVLSPYLRAMQTAAPLLHRFPHVPRETWNIQEFTYLAYDPTITTTAEQRRPRVEAYWQGTDTESIDGEGAESFAMFMERVQSAKRRLENFSRRGIGSVALFGHGQFIKAFLWALHARAVPSELSIADFALYMNSLTIANASLTTLATDGSRWLQVGVETDEALLLSC